jgi:aspartyl-tRNA(Asn)/glutamyl-tRNA(Gln) amidotransferase subunit A
MTRTVRDCALLLDGIVAHEPDTVGYAATLDNLPSGLRVGVVAPTVDDGVTDDVRAQIDAAVETIRALGFEIQSVALPHPEDAIRVLFGILYAEASAYHLPWLNTRPDDYSPNTRERLELGALLPATVYLRAQRVRRVIVAAYEALFQYVDLLVMPTAQATASRLGGPAQEPVAADGRDRMTSLIRFTGPFDVTGYPAISVPCGLDPAGLPVGIQFVTRPYADGLLLQFAHAFERAVAPRLPRPGGDSLVV